MPINKYPEETVEKILDVSLRLFVEKGYENTSVQDITDNLGGLTKGAIYHHFKSKEDLMLAVMNRQFEQHDAGWMAVLKDNTGMTGLEKLREIFRISLASPRQESIFRSALNMLDNPKMLILQMKGIMEESAPDFIQPIIEQGMRDGSIKTEYPQQLAEVILLLINLWVSPVVFAGSTQEMDDRLTVFAQILDGLGANFLDEEMIGHCRKLIALHTERL